MSRLRDVEAELAKIKKQLEAKEAEIRRKKAEPLADIFKAAILDDNHACKRLLAFGKEEIRVIAKNFVWDLERIIAEAGLEIEALHVKAAGSREAVYGAAEGEGFEGKQKLCFPRK